MVILSASDHVGDFGVAIVSVQPSGRRDSTIPVAAQADVLATGVSGVVRNGGRNPVWSEQQGWDVPLHFDVSPPYTCHLLLSAYDKDLFSDDVIGHGSVDLTRYLDRAAGTGHENVGGHRAFCGCLIDVRLTFASTAAGSSIGLACVVVSVIRTSHSFLCETPKRAHRD